MRQIANIGAIALVIVLGGALSLPLIQKTREAAARTQCHNNLKMVALATFNYRDTMSQFPPATMPNPALLPDRRLSWLLAIYPYVEADNIYGQVDKKTPWDAEENRWIALVVIKTYQCPAFPERRRTSTLVPAHYIGVAGLGANAIMLPLDDTRAGAFGHERNWTIAELKGRSTSSLIIVAETTRVAEAWTSGGWPTARGLEDDGPPLIGNGGQFGGIHKGGAMVAFADGSAGIIPTTDSKQFKAMATLRNDREMEPLP